MSARPDDMLRLSDALREAFPRGGMTVSGLRREASANRLVIFKIAGKDFTTLADIERMKELCRAEAKARASGPSRKEGEKTGQSNKPCGPSATDASSGAQELMQATLQRFRPQPKPRSPTTSSKSPRPRVSATVTRLR